MTEQIAVIAVGGFAMIGASFIGCTLYIAVIELYREYKRRKAERLRMETEKSFRGIK